jgi:glutamate racemase
VLATDGTLAGEKFQLLREQISQASNAQFLLQGCTGLADQIELGELDSDATAAMLRRYILPLLDQGADTLVLGCTHYPLVQAAIENIVAASTPRDIVLVDTGEAVARQLTRLLAAGGNARAEGGPGALLDGYTSASATALAVAFSSLLGLTVPVHEVYLGTKLVNPA